MANCTPPTGGGGGSAKGKAPKLSAAHVLGLLRGQPTLAFRVSAAAGAPKLSTLTVGTVPGLTFYRRREHKHLRVVGVTLKGAKLKSVSLVHGRLLIKLAKPTRAATVTIGEMPALDNISTCMCMWAGVITIVSPGQVQTTVP